MSKLRSNKGHRQSALQSFCYIFYIVFLTIALSAFIFVFIQSFSLWYDKLGGWGNILALLVVPDVVLFFLQLSQKGIQDPYTIFFIVCAASWLLVIPLRLLADSFEIRRREKRSKDKPNEFGEKQTLKPYSVNQPASHPNTSEIPTAEYRKSSITNSHNGLKPSQTVSYYQSYQSEQRPTHSENTSLSSSNQHYIIAEPKVGNSESHKKTVTISNDYEIKNENKKPNVKTVIKVTIGIIIFFALLIASMFLGEYAQENELDWVLIVLAIVWNAPWILFLLYFFLYECIISSIVDYYKNKNNKTRKQKEQELIQAKGKRMKCIYCKHCVKSVYRPFYTTSDWAHYTPSYCRYFRKKLSGSLTETCISYNPEYAIRESDTDAYRPGGAFKK